MDVFELFDVSRFLSLQKSKLVKATMFHVGYVPKFFLILLLEI